MYESRVTAWISGEAEPTLRGLQVEPGPVLRGVEVEPGRSLRGLQVEPGRSLRGFQVEPAPDARPGRARLYRASIRSFISRTIANSFAEFGSFAACSHSSCQRSVGLPIINTSASADGMDWQ